MQNDETNKNKLIDIASMLTIGGILLYSFGWIYWNNYFSTLHIDKSFIDISFERIIVTTWYNLLFVMLGFFQVYIYLIEVKADKKFDFPSAILTLIYSIFFIIYWATYSLTVVFVLAGVIILYFLLVYLLERNKINLNVVSKKWFLYIMIGVIYILSILFYNKSGKKDAMKFYEQYKADIELTLAKDSSVISGQFVAFMKNKYFIFVKDSNKSKVYIFNDNDIIQAKLKGQ